MGILDEGAKKRNDRPRNVPAVSPEQYELLSDEDVERLRGQARATVQAEKKKQAEDAYLARAIEEERRALEPEQELRRIVLDLPPFAQLVMIDGVQYFHGQLYEVPKRVFDMFQEIMARGWAHDEEVGSPNRRFYEKPSQVGTGNYASLHPGVKNTEVSPRHPDGVTRRIMNVA